VASHAVHLIEARVVGLHFVRREGGAAHQTTGSMSIPTSAGSPRV
jgi:hypothetical protein